MAGRAMIRVRTRWAQIERVPCPRCGAPAGENCHQPDGQPAKWGMPHFARREAAIAAGEYEPA